MGNDAGDRKRKDINRDFLGKENKFMKCYLCKTNMKFTTKCYKVKTAYYKKVCSKPEMIKIVLSFSFPLT